MADSALGQSYQVGLTKSWNQRLRSSLVISLTEARCLNDVFVAPALSFHLVKNSLQQRAGYLMLRALLFFFVFAKQPAPHLAPQERMVVPH